MTRSCVYTDIQNMSNRQILGKYSSHIGAGESCSPQKFSHTGGREEVFVMQPASRARSTRAVNHYPHQRRQHPARGKRLGSSVTRRSGALTPDPSAAKRAKASVYRSSNGCVKCWMQRSRCDRCRTSARHFVISSRDSTPADHPGYGDANTDVLTAVLGGRDIASCVTAARDDLDGSSLPTGNRAVNWVPFSEVEVTEIRPW